MKSNHFYITSSRYAITMLFLLVGFLAIYGNVAVANTISGEVSLPSDVAPAGGMYIDVEAYDVNGSGYAYHQAFIAEGESSVSYILEVTTDPGASWEVTYYCYTCNGYVEYAYYNSSGTTWDYNQATLLEGGTDHTGINIPLLPGNTISGEVSLLSGTAPAGGMSINVSPSDVNGLSYASSISVFIAEGESLVSYSLGGLPPNPGSSWRVRYYCGGCGGYEDQGYYNSSGTTSDINQATLLKGETDHTGINIPLLPANTISGAVSLPTGDAPEGGMGLYVQATNVNGAGNIYNYVTIPEGSSSVSYSLDQPLAILDASWRVYYSCYNCSGYAQIGYYNSGGTTLDPDKAALLAGGSDHPGTNIPLVPAYTISGNVFLPGSDVAPIDGLTLEVSVSDQNSSNPTTVTTQVYIPGGTNSASPTYRLEVPVPQDGPASWALKYQGGEPYGYADMGYYADDGTQCSLSDATLLPEGSDYSDKDLTLINECAAIKKKMICLPITTNSGDVSMVCFRNRRQ